jgi:hypothetical protein
MPNSNIDRPNASIGDALDTTVLFLRRIAPWLLLRSDATSGLVIPQLNRDLGASRIASFWHG